MSLLMIRNISLSLFTGFQLWYEISKLVKSLILTTSEQYNLYIFIYLKMYPIFIEKIVCIIQCKIILFTQRCRISYHLNIWTQSGQKSSTDVVYKNVQVLNPTFFLFFFYQFSFFASVISLSFRRDGKGFFLHCP